MSASGRVVIDTGVLVSAAIFSRSLPRRAVDAATESKRLLLSSSTFDELVEVLSRPKFDRYVSRFRRYEFLTELMDEAKTVEVSEAIAICRDPDDDKFLELAVAGQAECIISGDADLLCCIRFGASRS